MAWTKRQFIDRAFEELGLAGYVFNMEAEDLQSAGRTLDAMMASWEGAGISLAYPIAADPDNVDIAQNTSVPDSANECVYLNLAIRLGPMYGKNVSIDTKASARTSYDALTLHYLKPIPTVKMPGGYPLGAGNRRYGRTFTQEPEKVCDD